MNSADTLIRMFAERSNKEDVFGENTSPLTSTLAEGRQWLVIPIPSTYTATNWPIRYSAIDADGLNMAVAGILILLFFLCEKGRLTKQKEKETVLF